jgi:6-pyruvoyl-tetrahydropterin synthase
MSAPSLFLNEFTVLDCAYLGAGGVAGDSYYVSAEMEGALDAQDFLLDFSAAKKTLKALVDDTFDHKLLVPAVLARFDSGVLLWDGGELHGPRSAFELFPEAEINAGVIEYHLARLARAVLPANVEGVKFRLSSPARFLGEASFRYTHGLRYHTGNCQRLFHGHRNPVEVWVDGARSPHWEARLSAEWDGAHFVAAPTLLNRAALDLPLGERRASHDGMAEIAYTGSQGVFRGRIAASRVVLTGAEPSIETMSALGLERLKSWGLRGAVRVVAYEGLNKGAACEGVLE